MLGTSFDGDKSGDLRGHQNRIKLLLRDWRAKRPGCNWAALDISPLFGACEAFQMSFVPKDQQRISHRGAAHMLGVCPKTINRWVSHGIFRRPLMSVAESFTRWRLGAGSMAPRPTLSRSLRK